VIGIGRREQSLRQASEVGAITDGTLELAQGVSKASLVVVCTPVDQIAEHVLAASRSCPAGTLITDAGSTKANIVEQVAGALDSRARFIGSHPLAGSEKRGPSQSQADLFVGRAVVITPTARNSQQDLAEIEDFWTSLGAQVLTMTPQEHDRAVAASSHLAHLVAVALAQAVPEAHHGLAAGGLRDTTRIAAGDAELWTQILLDNRDNVLEALEPFERALGALRKALESGDRPRVRQILMDAKKKRDALGN
jgi:prephenate dehydrogenase